MVPSIVDSLSFWSTLVNPGFFLAILVHLRLRCFHDDLDNFPMDFLQRFTNLENLTVGCSSFIEIFSSEDIGTIMKLKTLTLNGLHKLEHFCKGKYEIQPILKNIEFLHVLSCSRLTIVIQSSSSHLFQNLDKLQVNHCSRLVNIMTLSVATSFVKLRVLVICDCEMVEEIVASNDDNDGGEVGFMKLERLELENLPRLTSFCKENFSFKFPLLETLYVIECPEMETFSHGILSATKLRKVRVTPYADGEWRWEGGLNTTIRKLFDEKVAMANLETMKLSSINTTNLWDDISGIQNLIHLTIDSCGGLKYLFSISVVLTLTKLQYLKITNCQVMEDIFVQDGELDNLQSTMKPLTWEEVKFPNLVTLVISHMDNLKSIYHGEVASNPFPRLSKMEISFCQKLLSVFPSYMLKNLSNLETLVVSNCATLEVLFETQGLYNVSMELLQLQVLDIRNCGVESIVANSEIVEEDQRFVFPKLTLLTFWYLKKLKSFYHGIHTLDCPSLKNLHVYHCNDLEMFKSKSQNFQVVPFHGQPLFCSVKDIPKIEWLSLSSYDVTSIYNAEHCEDDLYDIKALCLQCFHDELDNFPMDFIQRFTNLENLSVACSSFTEIFSSENVGTIMKLKTLSVNGLNKLEHFCKGKYEIQPILQNIETLYVVWCSRLTIVIQSSSSLLFQNLDTFFVRNCSGLVNIMTLSVARSFVRLRVLVIDACEMIEEIVASNDDSDGGEIAFMKLQNLELENLPRLTSFCKENFSFKFPLLETLYVIECPKMETFCHGILMAPMLRKVRVTPYAVGEWRWEGELNTTIRKLFNEKVAMANLETMKLSSINTTNLWDGISGIQNLIHLTIDSCGGLKYLFSVSVVRTLTKLQYLKITNCQVMEDIFVQDGELDNLQSTMKPLTWEEVKFPNLVTLVVSHMDNLKSIYHSEVASNPFPRLSTMEISFCQKLLSVFPSNVLKNLSNLETLVVSDCATLEVLFETQGLYNVSMELLQLQVLDIRKCGVGSIVANSEMVEEDPRFVFPKLTSLTFWRLGKLKSFYHGMHTLDCPSLKKIDVFHCNEQKMFKSKSQNSQEVVPFHDQSLFSSVKDFPKMEELSLSSYDLKSICNVEHCDNDLYDIKALSLQCFHDELDNFPMDFLQRFTNLENLTVACSSFIEIFSIEDIGTIMKLKCLCLDGLNELEHLCKATSEIQPILQNIETLAVSWCSKLMIVIPSLSSKLFQNLDTLQVGNCSGLVNIMTLSAAKSFLKIRTLLIYDCEMVEEIVVSNDDNEEGDIAFMKLVHLKLENLPSLTSFCTENFSFQFPSLETLYVIECPKMETFSHGILSAPKLKKVLLGDDEDGEWRWEGELNTTIRKLFDEEESGSLLGNIFNEP